MGIRSSKYICNTCNNEGSFWNGEEFEECPNCEGIDGQIDSIQNLDLNGDLEFVDDEDTILNLPQQDEDELD